MLLGIRNSLVGSAGGLLPSGGGGGSSPLMNGIQLSWSFDDAFDGSSQVYDQISNYPLVLMSEGGDVPTFVTGVIGNSIEFNQSGGGVTDGIQEVTADGSNYLHLNGDRTFSLWFFPTAGTGASTIAQVAINGNSAACEWQILSDQDAGNIQTYVFDTSGTGNGFSVNIAASEWSHIVVTWNNTTKTFRVYLNGVFQNSQSLASVNIQLGTPLSMGDDGTETFSASCQVDEFDIWDRILSDSEISTLYNGGVGLAYPF